MYLIKEIQIFLHFGLCIDFEIRNLDDYQFVNQPFYKIALIIYTFEFVVFRIVKHRIAIDDRFLLVATRMPQDVNGNDWYRRLFAVLFHKIVLVGIMLRQIFPESHHFTSQRRILQFYGYHLLIAVVVCY